MSLDFNDIVKQGEVKLKSRTVGVWQKRWLIFRKKSSSGPCRLEKYPDLKCAEIGQQSKTVSLERVKNISRTNSNGKSCMIDILPEDGPQRTILFSEESEARAWEEALRYECLESRIIQGNAENLPHVINGEMYHVNLIPSMALALSGECLLRVTSDNLILFDIITPSKELVSWPLNCLRRYGGDQHQFMFESGRHCKTGEGLFIFSTVQGDEIYQKVHSATTAICEAHRLLQRRADDTPALPTIAQSSQQNGRGRRPVTASVSLPIASDVPPIPPPRPRPSVSVDASVGNQPATRTSSLPVGALSFPGSMTVIDSTNNNAPYSYGDPFDPEGNEPIDEEKYLDATFRHFLALRKDDNEPPPSQRLITHTQPGGM